MPFRWNPITSQFDLTGEGGGNNYKDPTGAATTANLTATYNNGVSGVGATLTNSGALAAFSVDGISPALNSRILVKNQSTPAQNGIYVLTTVGSGSVAWVLTRASDYNQPPEINPGDLVPISSGLVNGSTIWEQTATVVTVGVSDISFVQFTSKEYSLSPYIVGDSFSEFTDIQPAIIQAQMDGHDSTNPVNIYVKPNAGGYVGDYTGADGVNLIAFGNGFDVRGSICNPVVIDGSYTHPDGAKAILQGFRFVQATDAAVIHQGGELYVKDLQFDLSTGATCFSFETATNKFLALDHVTSTGTGVTFSDDGSAQNVRVNQANCDFRTTTVSDLSYVGDFFMEVYDSGFDHSMTFGTTTATVGVFNSTVDTGSSYCFDFGAGTTGQFHAVNVTSTGAPLLRCLNAALLYSLTNCLGTNLDTNSFVSAQQTNGGSWITGDSDSEVYAQARTGYRGSEWHHKQSFVQTTDATVTTLASLALGELESATFKGALIASTADHAQTVGGEFCITARRETAGNITLVGSVRANVESTSAATFTCDIDAGTQAIRLRVTGVAATTYNWNTHYEWIKMLDNS